MELLCRFGNVNTDEDDVTFLDHFKNNLVDENEYQDHIPVPVY